MHTKCFFKFDVLYLFCNAFSVYENRSVDTKIDHWNSVLHFGLSRCEELVLLPSCCMQMKAPFFLFLDLGASVQAFPLPDTEQHLERSVLPY